MIFALRAIMVSLAFFALLYSLLSLVLLLLWKAVSPYNLQTHMGTRGLFTLRVIPFGVAASVSLFVTLPSFLMLETHAMDEDLGTVMLSLCAVLILGVGICRVLSAHAQTRRVVSACLEGATPLESAAAPLTVVSRQTVSPFMLVGLCTPRILVSTSARQLLSEGEFAAALRHETQHLRSHDNLRKVILNALPFPGMAKVDETWQAAAELAADNGAVSSRNEALDLAAALIKLTRHFRHQSTPLLGTGLVSREGSVIRRVERLIGWEALPKVESSRGRYAIHAACLACLATAVKLGPVLALMHSITERLVP
jgi:beta-lactamase regulating signal transducer with metallopeptidase domain